MATDVLGLSDNDIDRLLSEAESRLAGAANNGQEAIAAVAPKPTSTQLLKAPTPSLAPSSGQTAVVDNSKSKQLSVRVPPQPVDKKKTVKDDAGSDWAHMPRTKLTPELKRDLQILRMRDVVALGKQHFKKDNRKDFVPEYCQVGTIIPGALDGQNARLTRKERKRTIVEEVLGAETGGHTAKMNAPSLIRPLRHSLQGRLQLATARPVQNVFQTQLRRNASMYDSPKIPPYVNTTQESDGENIPRMPRSLEALYLKPLRREAQYGVPSCDLQLRSYSVRNLEFFCDFALRAAYFLGLPAFGPVPLPRKTERWTVPKSSFIFKKSQENFERITMRRLIQIKDGHPETVQIWLAFLQKHAYYGIGMKANVWEFGNIEVGKTLDASVKEVEQILEDKWKHLGHVKNIQDKVQDLDEFMATTSQDASPQPPTPKPRVVFSGIQPTGVPHLGNYLGALQQWKRLQDTSSPSDKLLFSIVDLHAITVPRERGLLAQWKREMLAALLAIGLDPERSIIFYQSTVPAHSELQWILSCTASMGYLSRMTQWKAADILIHRATHVPVGDDQRQHLEFARECVTNFNHAYGRQLLVAPETILSPAKRVMSLQSPTKKMSKSDADPRSRILLSDPPNVIRKKCKVALTDSVGNFVSYDAENRPGVSNLVEILSHLTPNSAGGASPEDLVKEFGEGAGLKDLKARVADAIITETEPIRQRYEELLGDRKRGYMEEVIQEGTREARESAEETMALVREAVELGV
ncbi:hypothetical protein QBC46DRAFT_364500 [Diplogelasinospora grovesii]|uniref:Small ribosomal subunit protein uS10m n=1 Tax=Diplogelasinospora grovesii TaxID=303347 RepID=A0AAN6N902_9PEZI|nr:hypothetical protein QBC46DRAFT_364500 [Diplogelasinospora grovesii]